MFPKKQKTKQSRHNRARICANVHYNRILYSFLYMRSVLFMSYPHTPALLSFSASQEYSRPLWQKCSTSVR